MFPNQNPGGQQTRRLRKRGVRVQPPALCWSEEEGDLVGKPSSWERMGCCVPACPSSRVRATRSVDTPPGRAGPGRTRSRVGPGFSPKWGAGPGQTLGGPAWLGVTQSHPQCVPRAPLTETRVAVAAGGARWTQQQAPGLTPVFPAGRSPSVRVKCGGSLDGSQPRWGRLGPVGSSQPRCAPPGPVFHLRKVVVRLRTPSPSPGEAGATTAEHMDRAAFFSRNQLVLEARPAVNQRPRNCGERPLPSQSGPSQAHGGGHPAPPCPVSSPPHPRAGLVQPPLPSSAQCSSSLEQAAEGARQFWGGGVATGCLRHWTLRGRGAGRAGGPAPLRPWVSVATLWAVPCAVRLCACAQGCVPTSILGPRCGTRAGFPERPELRGGTIWRGGWRVCEFRVTPISFLGEGQRAPLPSTEPCPPWRPGEGAPHLVLLEVGLHGGLGLGRALQDPQGPQQDQRQPQGARSCHSPGLSGVRAWCQQCGPSGGGRQDWPEPWETPIYGPGLASAQGQGQPTRRVMLGEQDLVTSPAAARPPPASYVRDSDPDGPGPVLGGWVLAEAPQRQPLFQSQNPPWSPDRGRGPPSCPRGVRPLPAWVWDVLDVGVGGPPATPRKQRCQVLALPPLTAQGTGTLRVAVPSREEPDVGL